MPGASPTCLPSLSLYCVTAVSPSLVQRAWMTLPAGEDERVPRAEQIGLVDVAPRDVVAAGVAVGRHLDDHVLRPRPASRPRRRAASRAGTASTPGACCPNGTRPARCRARRRTTTRATLAAVPPRRLRVGGAEREQLRRRLGSRRRASPQIPRGRPEVDRRAAVAVAAVDARLRVVADVDHRRATDQRGEVLVRARPREQRVVERSEDRDVGAPRRADRDDAVLGLLGVEHRGEARDAALDHLLVDHVGLVDALLWPALVGAVGVVDLHDQRGPGRRRSCPWARSADP